MALVLILSSLEGLPEHEHRPNRELERVRRVAAADQFGVHQVVDSPEDADVILFVEEPNTRGFVTQHPFVAQHREKCFVYDAFSGSTPFLPGIYANIEKQEYSRQRTRSGHYLRVSEHPCLDYQPQHKDCPYLFSFMGCIRTHRVLRGAILALQHPRAYLENTCTEGKRTKHEHLDEQQRLEYYGRFASILRASKFVLCPRGRGPSSLRLFETLRVGRPPVILADQWVPPEGPDWASFSVVLPEKEVDTIPAVLERLEPQAEAMGAKARHAWETWFAEPVAFHRLVNDCLDIKASRQLPESLLRFSVYWGLARKPRKVRRMLRQRKKNAHTGTP